MNGQAGSAVGTSALASPVSVRRRWAAAVILAGAILVAGLASLAYIPGRRELVLFGLYATPSHMFFSPFPIEPPLLHCAKNNPPTVVALLALGGACLAGAFDYLLFLPLLNHRALRPRFENTRIFREAIGFFLTSPFLMLVAAHLTPIPYYPLKFLALTGGYPFWKYECAIICGRTPRYLFLAWFGYFVRPPNWSLILLVLAFVVIYGVKYRRERRPSLLARATGQDEAP